MPDLSQLSDEQLEVYRDLLAKKQPPGRKPGAAEATEKYLQENTPPAGFVESAWRASGIPGLWDAAKQRQHQVQEQGMLATMKDNAVSMLRAPYDILTGIPGQIDETAGTVAAQAARDDYAGVAGTLAGTVAPMLVPGAATGAARGVRATTKAGKAVTRAVVNAAANPATRDAVGIISPRTGKILDTVARGKAALDATKPTPPSPAPAPQGPPITQLPGPQSQFLPQLPGPQSRVVPMVNAPKPAPPAAAPVERWDTGKLPPDPLKSTDWFKKGVEDMRARRVGAPDAPKTSTTSNPAPSAKGAPETGPGALTSEGVQEYIWDPNRGHIKNPAFQGGATTQSTPAPEPMKPRALSWGERFPEKQPIIEAKPIVEGAYESTPRSIKASEAAQLAFDVGIDPAKLRAATDAQWEALAKGLQAKYPKKWKSKPVELVSEKTRLEVIDALEKRVQGAK